WIGANPESGIFVSPCGALSWKQTCLDALYCWACPHPSPAHPLSLNFLLIPSESRSKHAWGACSRGCSPLPGVWGCPPTSSLFLHSPQQEARYQGMSEGYPCHFCYIME